MKIPHTGRKKALLIVDLQPTFIKDHNRHIVPHVVSLIKQVPYDAYVEAAWHSGGGSLWSEMMAVDHPRDENTHTVNEVRELLAPHNPLQVVKTTRSVFLG